MPGFAVKAATVLGTTDGTDAKGKSVRMFAIKVETQGGGQWSTAKRYTEFKELEAEMELGGLEVEAKLPKKKLTHGKKTLEKRRLALQRWLDSAISHHADHGILVQFLAQPTASADNAPAERKPPPPEFADVFELFGKLWGYWDEGDAHHPQLCRLFDADLIQFPIHVRSRRSGDRIAPNGMAGTKALKAVFNERSIPRVDRDRVAVIASANDILWVVGHRRSRIGRVTPRTKRVLMITCMQEATNHL